MGVARDLRELQRGVIAMTLTEGTQVIVDRGVHRVRATVIEDRGTSIRVRAENGKASSVRREKVHRITKEAMPTPKLSRPPSSAPLTLVAVPKETASRSAAYLAYVRRHPCMSCGARGPSEAHHWAPRGKGGGMGVKCDDYRTVPLCASCHRHWHDHARFIQWNGSDSRAAMIERQAELMAEWNRRQESV